MPHGDPIIYCNSIELFGHATGFLNDPSHQLTHVLQMHMAWHELGERVGNGDNGFAKVLSLHARGTPQRSRASHIASVSRSAGSILGHNRLLV